jgi:hypothetical protein
VPTNLLDRRVYALADVDRLLTLPAGTARRWIDGYDRAGVHYGPVIRAERTRDESVTWGEFVEARLLAEFRSRGASMQRLRPAVIALRAEFGGSWCGGCRRRRSFTARSCWWWSAAARS